MYEHNVYFYVRVSQVRHPHNDGAHDQVVPLFDNKLNVPTEQIIF